MIPPTSRAEQSVARRPEYGAIWRTDQGGLAPGLVRTARRSQSVAHHLSGDRHLPLLRLRKRGDVITFLRVGDVERAWGIGGNLAHPVGRGVTHGNGDSGD